MQLKVDTDSLGFLITDTARLMRLGLEQMITEAGIGVTAGEAHALLHIGHNQGLRQNVIAEKMGIEPMTLCTYLDRLERLDLVRRLPDPCDRRAKLIALTPEAETKLCEIKQQANHLLDEIQDGIDPQARAMLAPMIRNMRTKLQEKLNLCCSERVGDAEPILEECRA